MQTDDRGSATFTLFVLWGSLLAAQAIYVGLLVSGLLPSPEEPSITPLLPIILGLIAATEAVAAHVLWRRATGAGRPLHSARPAPARALQPYLLAWVLDESIAIYALVLGVLGFPPSVWGWFSLAGALLLLVHRPRTSGG